MRITEDRCQQDEIADFIAALRGCAKNFTWHIDRNRYIRATHADHWMTFDPITALHFHRTGEAVDTGRVWDVADGPMRLENISLMLAYAADDTSFTCNGERRNYTELRGRILKAVGLKEARATLPRRE